MQAFRRILPLAAAAALLQSGIAAALPKYPFIPDTAQLQHDAAQIQAFMQTLAALPAPSEPFASLRFDRSEQQLYCDGRPVGQSYGGFTVRDGELAVSAEALGLSAQNDLTPEEAAGLTGMELTADAGGCTVCAPFESSRLVLRCTGSPQHTELAETVAEFRDLHILQYSSPAEAYNAYRQYQADSSVSMVQPDRLYYADNAEINVIPVNNKDDAVSWIGADSFCTRLRTEKETLPDIQVAVLDTGVFAEHEWFEGRIAEGGLTMMTNESDTFTDAHGHGTHCAGIIAQSTPDNVSILPIKVLSDRGYGYDTCIYCGMLYAIAQGADVVSMSFGGNGESWLLDEGIAALTAADIPCIAAAGNERENAKYHHPASNPDCVTVSAVMPTGESDGTGYRLADFSNFGADVDFCAPGFQIQSATIDDYGNSVSRLSGTSMSTPFVAAAYADLLSYDPTLTSAQIYECLKENACDLGTTGFDPYYGWGMIRLDGIRLPESGDPAPVQTTAPDVSALLTEPAPEEADLEGTRARILPDVPFPHHAQTYYFTLERDTQLTLQMQSGEGAPGKISSMTGYSVYDMLPGISETLEAGSYILTIDENASDDPETQMIYVLHTEAVSLYMAEIAAADAFYTGEPITPHVKVTLNGEELRENIDYTVEAETQLVEAGKYRLNITGKGRYYDTCSCSFRIMPPDQDDAPLLTEGSHAPEITTAGTAFLYRWIPEHPQYCFSRTDNRPGTIRILDADGNLTAALSGISEQNIAVDVTPGALYYVSVSLEARVLTGKFPFSLTSDFRLLSDCTVSMPERLAAESGVPAYSLWDGDIQLTEGTDYECFGIGGETQPGIALVVFRGLGKYYGFIEQEYTLCPETLNPMPENMPESVDIPQDETVSATRWVPGTMRLFRFAAPSAGTYRLELPAPETSGVSAFVYDTNARLTEPGQTEFTLTQGEALQILCVTMSLGSDYDNDEIFTVRIVPVAAKGIWEADGIRFRLKADGTAAVIAAECVAAGGIRIPDTVIEPQTGDRITVSGIAAELRAVIADTQTVYGTAGGQIASCCKDYGLCFAADSLTDAVPGDITGDGLVNADDLMTLNRILSECSGMLLDDAVMQAADLNADGILDMADAHLMMAKTSH